MATYRYKAVSAAGRVIEGELAATTQHEAVAQLQALGHIPIRVVGEARSWLHSALTRELFASRAPSRRSLAPLIRQLGILLRAGLPLDRALGILADVAGSHGDAATPQRLLSRIRSGSALADAMAEEPLFPEFCVSMVRAGEISGSLEVVLDRLAEFIERSQVTRAKIKSALMYPVIVVAASIVSLALLFGFVVPRFRPFFADAQGTLPLVTRALLEIGDLVQSYWWLPPLLLAGPLVYVVALIRDPKRRRRWDAFVLKLPIIGELTAKVAVAHFSRILGTLLKSGVPLPNGLKIAGETLRNRVLVEAIATVTARVKEGKGLAEPLAQAGVFPELSLRLIRVGEEAARLDDMLIEVAAVYDWETADSVERMLSLLGPALTIGIGLAVAVVIGSIMMTVLSVYQLAI
jgi:general secretion pathway protein F